MRSGGLGACGALLMQPEEIVTWADQVRSEAGDAFNLKLWGPDPEPHRNAEHEARVRALLGNWGPAVPTSAGAATPPDFASQCGRAAGGPRADRVGCDGPVPGRVR